LRFGFIKVIKTDFPLRLGGFLIIGFLLLNESRLVSDRDKNKWTSGELQRDKDLTLG
jgi:hypothetical protein